MDSLTQIALGASVAGAVGFKPFGRKVLLAGAILGTLPDLDVLISYQTAIDNFTFHRGFSHSLIILSALSVFLYRLALYFRPHWKDRKKSLFLTILLPLITHPLLDAFTSYGTQLWWPIPIQPTSWSSIFIIDPLYTLPLLIAVLGLWLQKNTLKWYKINSVVLCISCAYLALGQAQFWYLKQKLTVDPVVKNSQIFISPTPFNIFVWRIISYQDDTYYETFSSIFNIHNTEWQAFATGRSLTKHFNSTELQRLEWFSDGLLSFSESQGRLIATDLRIGLSHYYPFSFSIAKREQHQNWLVLPSEKMPQPEVSWKVLMETLQ